MAGASSPAGSRAHRCGSRSRAAGRSPASNERAMAAPSRARLVPPSTVHVAAAVSTTPTSGRRAATRSAAHPRATGTATDAATSATPGATASAYKPRSSASTSRPNPATGCPRRASPRAASTSTPRARPAGRAAAGSRGTSRWCRTPRRGRRPHPGLRRRQDRCPLVELLLLVVELVVEVRPDVRVEVAVRRHLGPVRAQGCRGGLRRGEVRRGGDPSRQLREVPRLGRGQFAGGHVEHAVRREGPGRDRPVAPHERRRAEREVVAERLGLEREVAALAAVLALPLLGAPPPPHDDAVALAHALGRVRGQLAPATHLDPQRRPVDPVPAVRVVPAARGRHPEAQHLPAVVELADRRVRRHDARDVHVRLAHVPLLLPPPRRSPGAGAACAEPGGQRGPICAGCGRWDDERALWTPDPPHHLRRTTSAAPQNACASASRAARWSSSTSATGETTLCQATSATADRRSCTASCRRRPAPRRTSSAPTSPSTAPSTSPPAKSSVGTGTEPR